MPNLRELPDVLRAAGLRVTTLSGWETRTTKDPTFHPDSVVWHHDASPVGDSPGVPAFMVKNYPSAGAQLWVDRRGAWTVLSCQKANHAGAVLPGKPGNSRSYGIETDHTIGEAWPAELLDGLRRGTVAILRWLGGSPTDLHFHRTVCSPVGRKSDPDGLDLTAERANLAALWGRNLLTSNAPDLEDDLFTDADRDLLKAVLQQQGWNPKTGNWEGWPQTDGLTLLDAVADVRHLLRDPITSGVAGSTTKMSPRETWRNADAYGYRVEALVAGQRAAIDTLANALATAHEGLSAEELTSAVQTAIRDAVVKVDVSVQNSQETSA